jgi:hypothetical protein
MIWLLMAVLLLATPLNASAEFFVVPFMGVKFGGSTSIVDLEFAADDTKFTLGGAIMNIDDGLLGYEASFGYVLGYFDSGANYVANGSFVVDGTASAIILVPPRLTGYGLRPYGQAGAGLVHAQVVDDFRVFQVRRTMPVITVGVGAVGLFTNNVGVRFDVRYFRSLALTTDDESLSTVGRRISFSRFTIGLFLRL